ncbi:hypothetical protein NE237_008489 [Protea cynaroides]|uniref:Uncharacterized protein n=1 Tax=Protea cynaroides TaxID=273540 RepID=A0A9Q0KWU7_9MAGN|nr:hypothetical protein NE237_008489 [Protea cynaroides]
MPMVRFTGEGLEGQGDGRFAEVSEGDLLEVQQMEEQERRSCVANRDGVNPNLNRVSGGSNVVGVGNTNTSAGYNYTEFCVCLNGRWNKYGSEVVAITTGVSAAATAMVNPSDRDGMPVDRGLQEAQKRRRWTRKEKGKDIANGNSQPSVGKAGTVV